MKFVAVVFYGIFIIFLVFSAILLAGFVQIIFFNWTPPEIYTAYLASVIGESIALLLLYIKNPSDLRGVRNVKLFNSNEKINDYMLGLIYPTRLYATQQFILTPLFLRMLKFI